MIVLRSFTVLLLAFAAMPAPAMPGAERTRVLTEPVYIRPIYGSYRQCGGACLKSGSLSWFCGARQQCSLDCAIAPPVRRCASP
ncbi:hypothetical protein [Methylobacterium indicum]|uniref:Uncharacterized protein n=2 Tax=Methylobacterium indicum TaxID=1775910 RepID=A0A0J6RU38_9HYPH|nr:hypothetical protein [Methylobacterium indicum]KMO24178.1 hypothetical protein QR78_01825 [Methylobacterium indicum]KMO24799.1 hypothetical protein QR79_10415 [Methylobacterium indicum]BCM83492.1 hypothetical protein mvi_19530 [Methylobacterium indicum]